MYYKEAHDSFKIDYEMECANAGKPALVLNHVKVMTFLSKAYVYLGNTYELVEAATPKVLRLVSGQYEYTSGTGNSNIPVNMLRAHTVKLNDALETQIEKVGLFNMPKGSRYAGLPSKWTVQGVNSARKLIIDSNPDKSYADDDTYALLIYYKEKLIRYSGTAENTFSDLNFNTANTWGGEFRLPSEWDELIISGGVAFALGNAGKITEFYNMAEKTNKSKKSESYQSKKPTYSLGGLD